MAVLEYGRKDLEKLVGKKLTDKDIQDVLPLLGTPVEHLTPDLLTVEIFPNRPDMLSIEGFARAVAGFLNVETGPVQYKIPKGNVEVTVDKSVKDVRPHFLAAVIRNVKLTDPVVASMMQFQEKINDTMGRRRKKLASGFHDLDKVKPPFRYMAVDPDSISFVPLGMSGKMTLSEILAEHPKGQQFADLLKPYRKYPIIIDSKGTILSFPPIVNSEDSKVTEDTKTIFLDIDSWDLRAAHQALNIYCASFLDRGFKVESVKVGKEYTPFLQTRKMGLDPAYCNSLLGIELTGAEISRLLRKMRFGASGSKVVSVEIPPYRTDILHPMDLVEEIAIAYGYASFQPQISDTATTGRQTDESLLNAKIREIMTGFGFYECFSFYLSNPDKQFQRMLKPEAPEVVISNPRTSDFTQFRSSILPHLLEVVKTNSRYELPQMFFEVGYASLGEEMPKRAVAAVCASEFASYTSIRAYAESLAHELGMEISSISPADDQSYIPGRVAEIKAGNMYGKIGEIHPQVLDNLGIEYPVAVFELAY
ncbi:MAG: phenylalanine--tRNA ligase subunit beta [archaeon]